MEKIDRKSAKRDISAKRQSIIDAAILEFQDKGYENTSMDRIAEIAGASKRTVYNHFPNKNGLFQAVIEQYGAAMYSLKQIRYDAGQTLEEQLSAFADAELAIVNDQKWSGFTKALLGVFLVHPEMARDAMLQHGSSEDALAQWIQNAVDDKKLSCDNPGMAAKIFGAMIAGAFVWPAMYQGFLDPKTIEPVKKELIETFLCRYKKNTQVTSCRPA